MIVELHNNAQIQDGRHFNGQYFKLPKGYKVAPIGLCIYTPQWSLSCKKTLSTPKVQVLQNSPRLFAQIKEMITKYRVH